MVQKLLCLVQKSHAARRSMRRLVTGNPIMILKSARAMFSPVSLASCTLSALLVAAPALAQSNPLTETPARQVPAAPGGPADSAGAGAGAKTGTDANDAQQAQTTAQDATEIIRSLAPIAGGNPNAPRLRDVDADEGRRRVRVDYSRAVDLTVFFEYDSATLTPQARVQLEPLARALLTPELMPHRFLIAGHTDAVGDAQYNRVLSLQRAITVRTHLIESHGIDPARLVVHGWGFTQLKEPRNPRSGVNRRVEVALIAPPERRSHQAPFTLGAGFDERPPIVVAEEGRRPVFVSVGQGRTTITVGRDNDTHVTVVPHRGIGQHDETWRPLHDPRWRLASDALDDFHALPTPQLRERPLAGGFPRYQLRGNTSYRHGIRDWPDDGQ
jgi:OmpA-OmpF porin, OOP family